MRILSIFTLLVSLTVLSVAQKTAAQNRLVYDFETAAVDSFFNYPIPGDLRGLGTGRGFAILTDTTAAHHGTKALKVDWKVHASESWGGFVQLLHLVPETDSTFWDLSSATHLELWYNNIVPASTDSVIHARFKLHEAGGASKFWSDQNDHEDWYHEVAMFYDAAPGWKKMVIPLSVITNHVGAAPNKDGFSLPGWSGVKNNEVLDLDKIIGFSLELTTPGGALAATGDTAFGSIIWDHLYMTGYKYTPLSTFDSVATDTNYTKDLMSWSAGNTGNLVFTDDATNMYEGKAALKVDYTVHNTEDWGGYVNFSRYLPVGTYFPSMKTNSALLFHYKTLTAASTAKALTMRLFLYDWSGGVEERWASAITVNLDSVYSDWQILRIPLDALGGDRNVLEPNGFKVPGWETQQDGILALDSIRGFRLEFTSPGPKTTVITGSLMFDFLTPTGFRETDNTGPVAVTGISAAAGTFFNTITWTDVPGETGEIYDVYFSESMITDIKAAGVEVVKLGVPENDQTVTHALRAPATDQDVTYYYAVRATDKVGNEGEIGAGATSLKNTAKGVPTISMTPPANFTADGNLSEWSSITPIVVSQTGGTGFAVTNTTITNDADLSASVYLAMDATHLYVAFDVTDDANDLDTTDGQTWMHDAPDLFIGLYNAHGAPHKSFLRGKEGDHQFRFLRNRVLHDKQVAYDLRVGSDYAVTEKVPSGYRIEARLAFADIAAKLGDSLFVPKEGMRIPIDLSFNDSDNPTTKREGILTYSPANEDKSYQDPTRWLYTWIGNTWFVTGVQDNPAAPYAYQLEQNYPNPFNPTTTISYSLAKPGMVTMKIYDLLGREIARLVNEHQPAGTHMVVFDAATAARLVSGTYFYTIESGEFRSVKKMLLLK